MQEVAAVESVHRAQAAWAAKEELGDRLAAQTEACTTRYYVGNVLAYYSSSNGSSLYDTSVKPFQTLLGPYLTH